MEDAYYDSCRVCFPSARIRFVEPSGDEGSGPTFSPALFCIGSRAERFEEAFTGIGAVWEVPGIHNYSKKKGIEDSHFK